MRVRHPLELAAVCATITIAVGACSDLEAQDRLWQHGRWESVGGVPASDNGPLQNPLVLTGSPDVVYVADYGSMSIKAFSRDGRLIWSFGRKGKGPGELINPADLAVDGLGRIWIADPMQPRITLVSREGKLLRTLQQKGPMFRVEPADTQVYWLWRPLRPFISIADIDRDTILDVDAPDEVRASEQFVRDLYLIREDVTHTLVVFRWSSLVFEVNQSGRITNQFELVNRAQFPGMATRDIKTRGGTITRVGPDPKAVEVAHGATVCNGEVVVLPGGEDDGLMAVDVYQLHTMKYLGSRKLPEEIIQVDCSAGDLVGLVADPAPAVRIWRWVSTR